MKHLYKVTLVGYAIGDSPDDAVGVMLNDPYFADDSVNTNVEKVRNVEEIDREWRGWIPFGEKADRTCQQIQEMNTWAQQPE